MMVKSRQALERRRMEALSMSEQPISSVPLAQRPFEAPRPGDSPLSQTACENLLAELDQWAVIDGHHLQRAFSFPDFLQGLAFVNAIAGVAEDLGHHPDISLGWGRVKVELRTHDIDGLSMADFVLAARIDGIFQGLSTSN